MANNCDGSLLLALLARYTSPRMFAYLSLLITIRTRSLANLNMHVEHLSQWTAILPTINNKVMVMDMNHDIGKQTIISLKS